MEAATTTKKQCDWCGRTIRCHQNCLQISGADRIFRHYICHERKWEAEGRPERPQ